MEETVCSKTRSGRGCSLGGGLEQVCQKCKEPVLGSGLPGIRQEEKSSLPAAGGRERQGGWWERGHRESRMQPLGQRISHSGVSLTLLAFGALQQPRLRRVAPKMGGEEACWPGGSVPSLAETQVDRSSPLCPGGNKESCVQHGNLREDLGKPRFSAPEGISPTPPPSHHVQIQALYIPSPHSHCQAMTVLMATIIQHLLQARHCSKHFTYT